DVDHLSTVIKQGIMHKGFSLIDILQPCISFNKKNTYAWYRERVYKIDEEKDYNPSDKKAALEKAQEWGDRIPIGVIYKADLPVYDDQFPAMKKRALVSQTIKPAQIQSLIDELL
ncbi:MAG: 2-oxoacid ferredoxin oxidoreductase, partial [Chloroflexi bacterium]|nr:2-oxoacid ferredoxin oxidoreductase [Chloroflexota bacterium]